MPEVEITVTRRHRQKLAMRDVEAAIDNLIDVHDLADEFPLEGSRAAGAMAALIASAQAARTVIRREIEERERSSWR